MAKPGRISQEVRKKIACYYSELYRDYKVQSVSEICKELNISSFTLDCFFAEYCPTEEYEVKKIGLMILLSTKFGQTSQYKEIQKRYLEEIKRRTKIKLIKERTKEYNSKRLS